MPGPAGRRNCGRGWPSGGPARRPARSPRGRAACTESDGARAHRTARLAPGRRLGHESSLNMPTDLPNLLTLSRIVAIPILMALVAVHAPWADVAACVVFALAGITDYFDGRIARQRQI